MSGIGLCHQGTRLRKPDHTGLTIDMVFQSKRLRFRTWHVRLKDSIEIPIDEVATEVGIAQGRCNRVVVILGTGRFSQKAKRYAALVNESTLFQVVLAGRQFQTAREWPNELAQAITKQAPLALLTKGRNT
jgi:hypothetical protein